VLVGVGVGGGVMVCVVVGVSDAELDRDVVCDVSVDSDGDKVRLPPDGVVDRVLVLMIERVHDTVHV
jgi:hypothetical protein